MRKATLFSLIFLFVGFSWFLNPGMKQAEAITSVYLVSPSDSVKLTTAAPIFKWGAIRDPGLKELIRKYRIVVARDYDLTDRVWDDSSTLHPTDTITYKGPDFEEWETYYWSVRVQVDSITSIDTTVDTTGAVIAIDTTFVKLWYKFVRPFTLLYSTATLIEIPDSLNGFPQDLQTIQTGIKWSTAGDTVLVNPGTYYENIWLYKKGVMLASRFTRDGDTATIRSTIIDGSKSTRGQGKGSVVYFTSKADSSSGVIGFTITNGTGTEAEVGTELKVNGGGIFCEPRSTPTIAYNVITRNQAADDGGGIFCNYAAPNILRNIFIGNSAGGSGGAIQCYYSIKTLPPAVSSPPGREGEEDEGIEVMPQTTLPSSAESNSEAEAGDLENSLYPRDATEVLPALSSDPLAKPAVGNPPVAILEWFVRRDTVVQRDKILVGDTIVLDGSASYDPDSLDGDSIWRYEWRADRWQRCENADDWRTYTITSFTNQRTVEKPVTADMGGRYKIWLRAVDTERLNATSDTVYLHVERPPTAEAGDGFGISPGDTAWLDGSGSCDINPGEDTLLAFVWTQIEGPVSVTIENPDSTRAFFVALDNSYLGIYYFQLEVTGPDGFSFDTVRVACSNQPEALTFDSLAGFQVEDLLPLDASQSSDPDSGDYVESFEWKGISHITCQDTTLLTINADPTEEVQYIPASRGGGIYRLELRVRDSFGVISEPDTLVISVQLIPTANAGPDTVIRPSTNAYLHGSACEVNWDQRDSLRYWWQQNPKDSIIVGLYDSLGAPNSRVANVRLITSVSGILRFALRVTDPYDSGRPEDTVRVIVNRFPKIDSITPNLAQVKFSEGDSVGLRVFAHDDDAAFFGGELIYSWTIKNWPNSPDLTYKPEVIGSDTTIAKFVPLKHGQYQFELVVHDTISKNYQDPSVDPSFNIRTVTVRVDTTVAYPLIMENLISSNTAGLKGGGIDCFQSSPDIVNNIFYSNRSASSGGAICSRFLSYPYIERNIFFGNTSSDSTGGGIADLQAEFSPAASIGFRSKTEALTNDFWDNAGGDFYQRPANTSDNIYLYPRLIDPEYGDFTLDCSSPCLGDSIGLLLWLYPGSCETAPPVTMISLSLFQNPVATAVADFLINTDAPLKAPPAGYVTMGVNSPAPVNFASISPTTFRGSFVFTGSDTAHISVFASSVQEQDTSIVRDFAVQLIGAGKIGKLTSHDNQLAVLFPREAVKGDIYATCIPVSDDVRYSFADDQDKVALGEAYQLGPLLDFQKELTVSFPLGGQDLAERDKSLFSIYRYEKDGWEKQSCFLDGNSVCARVSRLGVFRLIYDADQEQLAAIPRTYQLFQNYPNPFNPQTLIKYDLPHPGHVNITVYNILGQKVKVLVDEDQRAGHRSVNWDGTDDRGEDAASGIYFYKIDTAEFEKTNKMVLLK